MNINYKDCKHFKKILAKGQPSKLDVFKFALETIDNFPCKEWVNVFGSMVYSFSFSYPGVNDDIISLFRRRFGS